MFTVGLGPVANAIFATTTMAIAVPTGVKIFNWIGTMWGGSVSMKTPMLFAIGFVAMFIIGGLSGMMHSVAPSDAQQQDTYFIVAHIHYVLFGGSLLALFSGIYYWFPKFTGRMLHEGIGKVHFWLMFIGLNLTFFPMHFLGLDGMRRRIYTYSSWEGFDLWNMVASIGAIVIAISILVFLHNFFRSLKRGEEAGNDPWDGRTLEWSIPSPPPEYNFLSIPVVDARDSFWEEKYSGKKSAPKTKKADDSAASKIHMPGLSYFPILAAIGMTIGAYGLLFNYIMGFIGVIIVFIAIYGWSFEPVSEDEHGHKT